MPSHSEKYGVAHRAVRKRWEPIVAAGQAVCWRCGEPIPADAVWHLGHSADGKRWMGPEHASCNVRDGARRGYRAMIANATAAATSTPREPYAAPERTWSRHWGGPFNPTRCLECRRLGHACPD